MIVGLTEFDEPETVAPRRSAHAALDAPSSTVPPSPHLPGGDGGAVKITAADLFDKLDRITNCSQCGTHMEAVGQTDPDAVLCDRCNEWKGILERRDSYIAANRRHRS